MKSLIEKIMKDQIWRILGDFGYEGGALTRSGNTFYVKNEKYELMSEYSKDECDVYQYKGKFKNISSKDMMISKLSSVFTLSGCEFEVYTQHNMWQNENRGSWQPLVTSVSAYAKSVRTAYGAAPMIALYNRQTGRGIVFHLLADYSWEMRATLTPIYGEFSNVQIEIGMNPENLCLKVESGEEMNTPEIIFYEFNNKTDLDCYKLHNYCIQNFKRKQMPVIYNTWLYKFDKMDYDSVYSQIAPAKKLGVEYFVIDAGWFGKGEDWWKSRGDWTEQMNFAYCGKVSLLADKVRENGMKFGMWFEIESADIRSDAVKKYQDFFIKRDDLCFLDFSNEDACDYIFGELSLNIEKYGLEFIKFDFNQDMYYDDERGAFMNYYKGYRKLIRRMKKKYPKVYLENCASGGMRMDLNNSIDFDSFWLSDDQSPYEGMRIFKESMKRLPPQVIEKWATVYTIKNFQHVYMNNDRNKIISTHDATWNCLIGVQPSFLKGFLTGGPIGFSCDMNSFTEEHLDELEEHIAQLKHERSFWENAVCRILVDTDDILVLQYSDMEFNQVKIVIYTYKLRQDIITYYPVLSPEKAYFFGAEQEQALGADIMKNGIEINKVGCFNAQFEEFISI